MTNKRNTGRANPQSLPTSSSSDRLKIGALEFVRYTPTTDGQFKNRWAWYGGEPLTKTECTRRATALQTHRLVAGG